MEGNLGTCAYHGCLRDRNCSVRCKTPTHLLFSELDSNRHTWTYALIALIGVFVDVVVSNSAVAIHDVVDEYSNVGAVETFIRIFEFGIVYWFNGFVDLVDANIDDVIVDMVVVVFRAQVGRLEAQLLVGRRVHHFGQ